MRKPIILTALIFLLLAVGTSVYLLSHKQSLLSPLSGLQIAPRPLLAYTFENLKKTAFPASQIKLGPIVDQSPTALSQMFYYSVPEKPGSISMLTASGLINLPKAPGIYPVIVMLRGYVDESIYHPGVGTQPAASVFVNNGFITLAPDFLGYGQSASPSADIFEARFQTYTATLALLSSVSTLNAGLAASYSGTIKADTQKLGLWAHSNGGHIALSVLAITGAKIPTVLWSPVSKSFPYSILYYTDEADDQGKSLRKALSDFETKYDTNLFSPSPYYNWIQAPLEIHQGEADHEVPVWWSDDLVATLKKDGLSVHYFTYPGADHNLLPSAGWSTAVTRSLEFYKAQLK